MKRIENGGYEIDMKITTLLFFAVLIFVATVSNAQDVPLINTAGRTRIEAALETGSGLSSVDVGTTNTGETVKISGGGGSGFSLTIGYGLTRIFDIDATLGSQESKFIPPVKNASGTFKRNIAGVTLKYKIPLSDTSQMKIGAGLGSYRSGEMNMNTSDIPGGSHVAVHYGSALGKKFSVEYEGFGSHSLSFLIGLKYYMVTYAASSASLNGASRPTGALIDDLKNLNGNGVDLTIGLAYYF